jgi:hypothetical protein
LSSLPTARGPSPVSSIQELAPRAPLPPLMEELAPRPPAPPRLVFDPHPPLPDERTPKPRGDLFDLYLGGDVTPLLVDARERPMHYSSAQKDALERLQRGRDTTAHERAELVLQLMRRSEAQKLERQTRRTMTQSVAKVDVPVPAFENQDLFRGAIKLI